MDRRRKAGLFCGGRLASVADAAANRLADGWRCARVSAALRRIDAVPLDVPVEDARASQPLRDQGGVGSKEVMHLRAACRQVGFVQLVRAQAIDSEPAPPVRMVRFVMLLGTAARTSAPFLVGARRVSPVEFRFGHGSVSRRHDPLRHNETLPASAGAGARGVGRFGGLSAAAVFVHRRGRDARPVPSFRPSRSLSRGVFGLGGESEQFHDSHARRRSHA